ncbi:winged helix-turn-helix transcriptional regulator [Streptomyces sp. NPDC002076]
MLPIRMQNKWAPLVMRLLSAREPFSELRRALPRASPKELTQALRSRDRDGFIIHDAGAPATASLHSGKASSASSWTSTPGPPNTGANSLTPASARAG